MNLRNRIAIILDLIGCRKSEESEIDLAMTGRAGEPYDSLSGWDG